MPLILVSLYPGRSKEQKDEFAKALTDAAVQILKTKPEHVIVVYDEKPKENCFSRASRSRTCTNPTTLSSRRWQAGSLAR